MYNIIDKFTISLLLTPSNHFSSLSDYGSILTCLDGSIKNSNLEKCLERREKLNNDLIMLHIIEDLFEREEKNFDLKI